MYTCMYKCKNLFLNYEYCLFIKSDQKRKKNTISKPLYKVPSTWEKLNKNNFLGEECCGPGESSRKKILTFRVR